MILFNSFTFLCISHSSMHHFEERNQPLLASSSSGWSLTGSSTAFDTKSNRSPSNRFASTWPFFLGSWTNLACCCCCFTLLLLLLMESSAGNLRLGTVCWATTGLLTAAAWKVGASLLGRGVTDCQGRNVGLPKLTNRWKKAAEQRLLCKTKLPAGVNLDDSILKCHLSVRQRLVWQRLAYLQGCELVVGHLV